MAMTTSYSVWCKCGHIGKIIQRENDTPYSSSFWSKISLVDLSGNSGSVSEQSSWDEVFKDLKITCPTCGEQLTGRNIKM